jgi:hypothetical protein
MHGWHTPPLPDYGGLVRQESGRSPNVAQFLDEASLDGQQSRRFCRRRFCSTRLCARPCRACLDWNNRQPFCALLSLVILFNHECRIKIAGQLNSDVSTGLVRGLTKIHNFLFQRHVERICLRGSNTRHTEYKHKNNDLSKRIQFAHELRESGGFSHARILPVAEAL